MPDAEFSRLAFYENVLETSPGENEGTGDEEW